MITKTTGWKTSDDTIYDRLEEAHLAEVLLLLKEAPVSTAREVVKWMLKNHDRITDMLNRVPDIQTEGTK